MTPQVIFILILIGLFAGMLSGFIGVGGGVIVIPALIYFLGYSQHQAQGTSLGLLLPPVGILAVMNYYQKGFIDIRVVAIMCVGFIAGGYIGSKLSLALPVSVVKKAFAIILLYTAFKLMGWDAALLRLFKSRS